MSGVRRSERTRQLPLRFPYAWGGARRGAGRKPGPRPNTPHHARPLHRAAEPVHVTLRARIAPLRSQFVFPTVRLAIARAARRDPERFRVVHFAVQRDHVHLIVEATDARALSSGVRSVAIRIARYVNELLLRRGRFWADRWHGRALKTPREMRNAIVYVLANFRKHARRAPRSGIDPFSSAAWFDGWREWCLESGVPPPFTEPAPWWRFENGVPAQDANSNTSHPWAARTWLARQGWRKYGPIGWAEAPAT
jgi:REP element-mobilizing transposase RayT